MATRRQVLTSGTLLTAAASLSGPLAAMGKRPRGSYEELDATALAQLVRSGTASAGELLDEALARAATWNPLLNAIVLDHRKLARQSAETGPEGPLAGVPFLLKDLGIELKGTVTSGGSRFFRDDVATRDSFLTERYKQAGLVIFGKTASPELGKSPATESLLYGATRNPWELDHSPGGSSGGSAAAVAAGILPAAHGSDGGGSIRIPSSCCGLFGLKPSRFRVPLGPDKGDGGGMTCMHALTRSVRDSALLLDISRGPAPGEYGSIRAPAQPYVEQLHSKPEKLRIGVMRTPVIKAPVHPECDKAVDVAINLCEGLGHRAIDIELPIDAMAAYQAAGLILTLSSNVAIRGRERELGRPVSREDLEPITWTRLQQYTGVSAEDLAMARDTQVKVQRQVAEFMRDYDVILSPTLPTPPARVGDMSPQTPIAEFDRRAGNYSLFTLLYNLTGQPAMSVPLHWSGEGLPVGVQFAGRYAEEGLLLQLAAQLEQAKPWSDQRPVLPT